MKKVLIITYYWPPSGGAGVQRWVKFAKYLSRLNVEVHVLTVDPKYATYPQIDESLKNDILESVNVHYSKSFELYSVYKKVSTNKEVPYGGFANTKTLNFKEKVLRFIRGNFFLPDPRRGWNTYAFRKAKEIITTHNINTVITTSPPHSTQLIGLKLKKKLNIKWIADFRDPWTDIYYYKDLYPTKIANLLNTRLERKVLKESDKTFTVSKDIKKIFSNKVLNIESKIEVIPNGFDIDDFPKTKVKLSSDVFYITYTGTISNDYPIEGFINGIKRLSPKIKNSLRIRFVGKIAEELVEKFKLAGLGKTIELISYVKHSKAIEYMVSSHILLLIIPEIENNKGILTGKLFEYIGANRPILFIGPKNGDAAQIILDSKSGFICGYSDEKQISISVTNAFNNPKEVENYNTEKYSRENLTIQLLKILSDNYFRNG